MSIKITLLLFTVCLSASNVLVNAVPQPAFGELVRGLNQLNTIISNFQGRAAAQTDAGKRAALQDGIAALQFAHQNGNDIRTNLTDLDDRTGESTTGRVSDAQRELRNWRNGQVTRLRQSVTGGRRNNRAQTNRVRRLSRRYIAPIVRTNNQALLACQTDVVALQAKAQTELKNEMNIYTGRVNRLLTAMRNCQRAATTAATCKSTIDSAAAVFQSAPIDVLKLRANGKPLFIAETTGAQCVAAAKTKMETDITNTTNTLNTVNTRIRNNRVNRNNRNNRGNRNNRFARNNRRRNFG